jgi:hypothetical protein
MSKSFSALLFLGEGKCRGEGGGGEDTSYLSCLLIPANIQSALQISLPDKFPHILFLSGGRGGGGGFRRNRERGETDSNPHFLQRRNKASGGQILEKVLDSFVKWSLSCVATKI